MSESKELKMPTGVYLRFPTQEAYEKFMNNENEGASEPEENEVNESQLTM